MSYFTLTWLREGMIVQRTVSDRSGKVLVKAGAILTAQDLVRLEAEDIKGVEVQVADTPPISLPEQHSAGPQTPEQIEQRLEQRFRHLDPEHPLVKELLRLCRMRETLHLAEPSGYDS